MTLTLTILGCGSSGGVPRIGGVWGKCDPNNPKNRRMRCSVLAERTGPNGKTRVLIDTSPDMRAQMLMAQVPEIDAVLYTHEHADHTHGIDELRAFHLIQRKRIPCYADAATGAMLQQRFAYCFEDQGGYPAIASLHGIHPGREVTVSGKGGDVSALPFTVQHGNIEALGFRFGDTVYLPDVNALPNGSWEAISELDTLIIDGLRYAPHQSHFSLAETLDVIAKVKPKHAVITNMHIDLDYATLESELPPNVRPAFDGLRIELESVS